MAKERIDLKKELESYKFKYDLLQKIPCSPQENKQYRKIVNAGGKLPDGVFLYDEARSPLEFYTIYDAELTEAETQNFLLYTQLDFLRVIKNCLLFFTVLTIVGMIVSFIILTN